jgi:hypothetical protein
MYVGVLECHRRGSLRWMAENDRTRHSSARDFVETLIIQYIYI